MFDEEYRVSVDVAVTGHAVVVAEVDIVLPEPIVHPHDLYSMNSSFDYVLDDPL